MDHRAVYKALGDDTRFALYSELMASAAPLSTGELAERLSLHHNTIRPHLERMREVGLLDVESESQGAVGRPQHRYRLAAGAPGAGMEPPAMATLAGLLAEVAASGCVGEDAGDQVADVGRAEGRRMADSIRRQRPGLGCIQAVEAVMDRLGFGLETTDDGGRFSLTFTHCPFRDLAEAHPEVVCHLHRGIAEGAAEFQGDVTDFGTLADPRPCQAAMAVR
ncbi:MAG TPA: helix-turn-helix domain-containing protein [Acidimicrobiales bacterium]|nr:helix-turn-helix domain-containing protein [Acidimicrobiales bacterium]